MNICILTYRYPTSFYSDFAFVKQLVDMWAKQGHHCFVVSPYNILHYKRFISAKWEYNIDEDKKVIVFRPYYISLSSFHIGNFNFSSWSHAIIVNKILKNLPIKPDVIYGHFWHTAFEGYQYANKYKIPLFVATGESSIAFRLTSKTKEFCNYIKGVICVSSKNRDESITLGLASIDKCHVFPNAIDGSLFKQLDKKNCRDKLNLPQNIYIVIFVGWFINRKGATRVAEAINMLPKNFVHSIFIGTGDDKPQCDNIIYQGGILHEDLPLYLNAADVFVLPTLGEGCCNAIIEAMACGLPIISSNLSFNWDVLNDSNSIMVDPNNIKEIASAIERLKDKDKQMRLSKGSLHTVSNLTIEKRAENIINFMDNLI